MQIGENIPLEIETRILRKEIKQRQGGNILYVGGGLVFSHEVEETTRRKEETSRKEVEENYLNTKGGLKKNLTL